MPYLAKLEKAGIPTVVLDFEDQDELLKETALESGLPNARFIHASRTLPGPEDVDQWIEPLLEGLTKPLTTKEKEKGVYAPPQPRILFEGTLDEAQAFYQQTRDIPLPVNAPIAVYTDGFPIIVPTEERVKEMLTGTSHKPDEQVVHQSDQKLMQRDNSGLFEMIGKKGTPVQFYPRWWTATVEKVATIAVMAGCKPEHLPVVLAIAESGCPTSTTNFPSQAVCLSGPIVKEIRMNTGCGHLGPGSVVNGPIGRTFQLMALNLGGAVPGINRMGCQGSPLNNGGTCYGENADGLPPGWKGLNEEYGFKKGESMVMVQQIGGGIVGSQFSPGGYRAFQKSGHGGLARRADVKGTPGPHNWLEYVVPALYASREGGWTFVMVPEMARHLYDYGFKTKDEAYEWLYKASFEPLRDYRNRSWVDIRTNGWMGIEPISGKHWKELSDDYMVPVVPGPFDSCIVVAGGQEEASVQLAGGHGTAYSIDAWR